MTLFFPDISSYQSGISLKGALAVCIKITENTDYVNPDASRAHRNAKANGCWPFFYHFLHAGNEAAQASWCFQHVKAIDGNGKTPVMLDVEPTSGSSPSVRSATKFIDAYRALGGVAHLHYFPHWYWLQKGSPSFKPLASRKVALWSSAYTTYTDSDSGTGWQPYGGQTPQIWQYTSSQNFNGYNVDFSAFRGTHAGDQSPAALADTVKQLKNLATTGSIKDPAPPPGPAPSEEEDDVRMLVNGTGKISIISLLNGSMSWISFGCDNTRTGDPPAKIRVACHSSAKSWSQVEHLQVASDKKYGFSFTERDVDMVSIQREGNDAGDEVSVGYNLG